MATKGSMKTFTFLFFLFFSVERSLSWLPSLDGRRNQNSCTIVSAASQLETPRTFFSSLDSEIPVTRKVPFTRAREIGFIVLKDVIAPLALSVKDGGFPSNWDAFWSRKNESTTNAAHVASALEKMGPTYVKFGQALSARPDIIPRELADALSVLQDGMQAFDNDVAMDIIRTDLSHAGVLSVEELNAFMESLSPEPVAAASIGQVYKGHLPGYGAVAVKVKRPGVRAMVEQDAEMLRTVATWVESIPGLPGQDRLVAAKIVDAVDEFMARMFEELDYRNEAANIATFAELYSIRGGRSEKVKVVVPDVLGDLCSDNILIMEWIEGSKLTDEGNGDSSTRKENLDLVQRGIECTLSQLLNEGVLHADPHSGNLIKVKTEKGTNLGYLDFGILSTVPSTVRDGLVCAVVQLVFAKNVEAVAELFGELQLLSQDVLDDPVERAAFTDALNQTLAKVLVYPETEEGSTAVPTLRFDNLLVALSTLVARFEFTLPPYFLNNARALATLEGIARRLDPSFNVLNVVYPYALNRILNNPSMSYVVEETLLSLVRSPETRMFDPKRFVNLLNEVSTLTGRSRKRIFLDVVRSKGGNRVVRNVFWEFLKERSATRAQRRRILGRRLHPSGTRGKSYFRL